MDYYEKVSCRKQFVHQHSCHKILVRARGLVDPVKIFLYLYSLITMACTMQNLVAVSHTCRPLVTRPPWSFWTCLRPSIWSTTPSFCSACRRASVSAKRSPLVSVIHVWPQPVRSPRPYTRSSITYLVCGVPQGSVLGRYYLCSTHTADLISLIESYSLSPYIHTDVTQIYGSCPPAAADSLSLTVSAPMPSRPGWNATDYTQPG